ncbi:MAG TPA: hypothetical protein P5080_05455 [Candidatus Paceibacterota bacterium]|nr:hypothetical protein [Candidatus Pacearchaeota archaeon]HRZ51394.1 hypothetical protein [Candidatus Paceibacterota bacterium]HSA37116.1 hypothetical protein [Candidatus Paceibacterota bacterium]
MKHIEIPSKGLEYTLLKDASQENLIGIEIVCNAESSRATRKFIEQFPDLIGKDGWRINFWAKGIALAADSKRVEIALPKQEMAELKTLFDKAKPEKKMNMIPIYGKYPGFQLLAEA